MHLVWTLLTEFLETRFQLFSDFLIPRGAELHRGGTQDTARLPLVPGVPDVPGVPGVPGAPGVLGVPLLASLASRFWRLWRPGPLAAQSFRGREALGAHFTFFLDLFTFRLNNCSSECQYKWHGC